MTLDNGILEILDTKVGVPNKITVRMDTSQVVQFSKCPTFHNFVSIQNLVRRYTKTTAMDRGTVFHGLLERYYTAIWQGQSWPEAQAFALSELNALKTGKQLDDSDYRLITLRFCDYVVKYHKDKLNIASYEKDGVKKPCIEMGFSIPILDTPRYYFVLEGRIDMITIMSERHVIWDHKGQGRSYLLYGQGQQSLNYCLAAGTNLFMHNYIRFHEKVQTNTFERKLTTVPRRTLGKQLTKVIALFMKAAHHKLEDDFPNASCSDIGFGKVCPYTQLCEQENEGVKAALVQRDYQTKTAWEPWSLEEVLGGVDD